MVAKGGRTGILGLADEIYLYIEWIKNEVLQYGTGNFIQYLGINHKGKNIYVELNQFAVQHK